MTKPQQPELGRSGHTPVNQGDHAKEVLEGHHTDAGGGNAGPVPEENQPGHRPARDQDKPDPERFRARLTGGGEGQGG